MQEAIPYSNRRTWTHLPSPKLPMAAVDPRPSTSYRDDVVSLVRETPVLVLGNTGCCMCHVVRRLLLGLGVNPAVYEVDGDDGAVVRELKAAVTPQALDLQFPAVFIGGRHVGGLDRIMAAHISGDLVPILKEAGALWL